MIHLQSFCAFPVRYAAMLAWIFAERRDTDLGRMRDFRYQYSDIFLV